MIGNGYAVHVIGFLMKNEKSFMESKIVCGDSLEEMKKLGAESVSAIITDPPFGIDYQSAWRTDKTLWKPKIANDGAPFIWWLPEAFRLLKAGGGLACFVRFDVEQDFRRAMQIAGFTTKAQVIWDKVVHGMGDLRGDFAPCHENIIFATKGRFLFPEKRPKTVIRVQRVDADKLAHPNEKPVEVMSYFIAHLSKENDTVLDPFCGVGPTLIAAKMLGRSYIGIEREAEYVEIAKARVAAVPDKMI